MKTREAGFSPLKTLGFIALARVNSGATRGRLTGGSISKQGGFSLLELIVVITLIMVGTTIAVIQLLPTIYADSALQQVEMQFRQARQSSIDQRRDFLVTFQGTNELVVVRQEVPAGTTTISDTFLPQNTVYMTFAGVPDTPDGFGNANAVNFSCPGNTTPCSILFQSDGTVVLTNNTVFNGTVFLGVAGKSRSARAVTVMGSTGRVRAYRWSGSTWF